ncbi:MAG: CPBP family intramembrane metalloprotease [Saccharofermentans sp.]|nr:CPBP family intramembrane metalloprotease [Saccharofermentans sp.]
MENNNINAYPQMINGEQVYVLKREPAGPFAPVPQPAQQPSKGRKVAAVFISIIPWVILQVVQTIVLLFVFVYEARDIISDSFSRGRIKDVDALMELLGDSIGPTMLIYGIISAVGFGIFYMIKYVKFREIGRNLYNVGWRFWLGAFIASVGAQTFAQGFVNMIQRIPGIDDLMEQMYSNNPMYDVFNTDNMTLSLAIALVLIVPIAEELVFRGIAGGILAKAGHSARFILVFTALYFAIAHGNVLQIIYVAVLGFAEGYMYIKKKTIIPTILMHIFYNFLGTFPLIGDTVSKMPYPAYPLLALAGLGMVAGAFFLARSEKNKDLTVNATQTIS